MTAIAACTLTLTTLGLMACSTWQRHPLSGYADNMESEAIHYHEMDLRSEKLASQKIVALQELGYAKDQPLEEMQEQRLKDRLTLKDLESAIRTNDEKTQYFRAKPHLENDPERIYFLRLPTMEVREAYLQRQGIQSNSPQFTALEKTSIDQNDISPNMRREAVRESWGEPEVQEVSGNPLLGNERWTYERYVPTPDGYVLETRTLYFQGGRLTGWNKSQKP